MPPQRQQRQTAWLPYDSPEIHLPSDPFPAVTASAVTVVAAAAPYALTSSCFSENMHVMFILSGISGTKRSLAEFRGTKRFANTFTRVCVYVSTKRRRWMLDAKAVQKGII